MRWSTVGIVWALAVFVVAVAWWWPAETARSQQERIGSVFGLNPPTLDEITHIDLDHEGKHWSFERDDDGWWQVLPFRHRMRGELLSNLPASAISLEVLDAMDGAAPDLPGAASLGLDPPAARIVLQTGTSGTPHLLDLGRRGMAGRAWAQRGGQILVVDGALHDLLEQEPPETWRDLRLFPGLTVDAEQIDRTVSDETLTLVREGRRWRITAPLPTRADGASVLQHIAEIAGTRGEGVMFDEPANLDAFGLDPPIARITTRQQGRSRTLLVGDRVGGASQARYAMVEGVPSILRINARDVDNLLGDPTVLVDHTGTNVSLSDVSGVRIVTSTSDILLKRQLDAWFDSGENEAIASQIELLLSVLIDVRAAEVTLHETYPSDLEVATVTLLDAVGGPLDTVRVLRELRPPAGQGRWALENGDRVLRVMPDDTEIPLQPSDFGLPTK